MCPLKTQYVLDYHCDMMIVCQFKEIQAQQTRSGYLVQFVFRDGKMDDKRLKELVKLTGKERLVLDLSCRKKVC